MNETPIMRALAAADPVRRDPPADPTSLPAQALLARTVAQPVPATPERAPRRRPAAVAASVALVLVVSVGIAVLQPGGPPAYASWQATPSAASAATLTTAEAACAPAADEGGPQRVLEQRGSYVLAVYADDGVIAQCLTGTDVPTTGTSTTAALPSPTSAADIVVYDAGSQAWGAAEGEVVSVVGRAGADVDEITVRNEAGLAVEASIDEDGWFTAWWPGASPADTLTVTTDAEVVTSPIEQG